jgi:hypothetical protein
MIEGRDDGKEDARTGENSPVSVEAKNFVGIGKMRFNTPKAKWNIPHLHFLVDLVEPGRYEATVLEFGLVSGGKKQEEAIERLAAQIYYYIFSVMENGDNYSEFIESVDSHVMDDYWRRYRTIEFSLARDGNDLSNNIDEEIKRAVKSIISEKTDAVLDGIAKNNATEHINEAKRMASFAAMFDLEYTVIGEAA